MPLTQTTHYFQNETYRYFFGIYAKANWALELYGVMGLVGLLWGSFLLFQALKQESDTVRRKQIFFVFIGLIISGFLAIASIPTIKGIELYPPSNFTFIPFLIMGYGVFHHDLVRINAYTKKRFAGAITNLGVAISYLALVPLCFWALEGMSWNYIAERIVPYGIPPLLSFLVCTFLSLLALRLGRNQKEILLFSIGSLLYVFLNLDILLNGIVDTAEKGLFLNRLDHHFFVFVPAVFLHLIYLITHYNKRWSLVYVCYALGLFILPFVHTEYYFKGMFHFYWGFFAKKAIGFDIFGVLSLFSVIYGSYILYLAYKHTEDPFQKTSCPIPFLGLCLNRHIDYGKHPRHQWI